MKLRRTSFRLPEFGLTFTFLARCPIAFALSGDLNDDGEVSLPDVGAFVGCIEGPNDGSIDPSCVAGDFNSDGRIDLHDVAAFQQRFGFGVGPPRIDRFSPPPGEWIVDDVGLTHVEIGFSEPVIVPREAIVVWLVSDPIGNHRVEGFTHSYDADSDVLTLTFDPPLKDDRITVVLDYTIEDLSGRPLDGEIHDPRNAKLPSGDGINGGQGVFRINVLQGDANRNGIVDATDSKFVRALLGVCDGEAGFDTTADLNGDGCVTAADADIVSQALGHELPSSDGQAPTVVNMRADGPFGSFDELWIDFDEIINGHGNALHWCYLTQADGTVVLPTLVAQGFFGYSLKYAFLPASEHCNLYKINVSNALSDLSGELLIPQQPCTCLVDCPPYGESP